MDTSLIRKTMREIMTISRCINYIRNIQFKKMDIGKDQHQYLTRIYENEGLNQEELSYMLKIDKATVAKNLKKLEDKGFIKRIKGRRDNRQWLIYPTEKLRTMYSEIEQMIISISKKSFDGLSDDDMKTLLRLTVKVTENTNNEWVRIKKQTNVN